MVYSVVMAITTIRGYGFVFQVITMGAESLVSKKWLTHLPADG